MIFMHGYITIYIQIWFGSVSRPLISFLVLFVVIISTFESLLKNLSLNKHIYDYAYIIIYVYEMYCKWY